MSKQYKKVWTGSAPARCDLCGEPITTDFVDGVEQGSGSWLYMCLKDHKQYGTGLGTGRGQRYHRNNDGLFEKVEG